MEMPAVTRSSDSPAFEAMARTLSRPNTETTCSPEISGLAPEPTQPGGDHSAQPLLFKLLGEPADSARVIHQLADFFIESRVRCIFRGQSAHDLIE